MGELPPPLSPGSAHPELSSRPEDLPPLLPEPSVLTRQDKRKWEEEEGSQVFEELGRVVSMGAQLQSEYTAVLQLPRSPKRVKVVMDKLDSLGQRKRLLNGRVVAFVKKKEELRKEEKTTCTHCRASLNSERSRYCGIQYTALYTVHCTLYTVHCTLYTVHCTLYTVHCTLYIVHCTLYTVHCTVYTVHCTTFIVQCSLCTESCTVYTLYCKLYTIYCTPYTVHCTPYTVHCTLYTVHRTLYTVHCTLYTVHCTLYTVHCSRPCTVIMYI